MFERATSFFRKVADGHAGYLFYLILLYVAGVGFLLKFNDLSDPRTVKMLSLFSRDWAVGAQIHSAHFLGLFFAVLLLFHYLKKLQHPLLAILVVIIFIPYLFAYIYVFFHFLDPNTGCLSSLDTLLDAYYFSVVTYTTLGYGDIHPQAICKFISSVEALLGLCTIGAVPGVLIAAYLRREASHISQ